VQYPARPTGPWISVDDARDCCASAEGLPDVQVELAVMSATEFLYERSARQFRGLATATVRPCSRRPCTASVTASDCSCRRSHEVSLGLWPVSQVVEVLVDGSAVPSGGYYLAERRRLVRLPGPGPDYENPGWPRCQNLDLPSTEPGTFEVTLVYGIEPPTLGMQAARALTCELLKACSGADCQLPVRTRSVSRQGVTVVAADPATLPQGKTGLQEVDMFLAAFNPDGRGMSASVWSPDISPRVRRV
jgi:hypothetical protein